MKTLLRIPQTCSILITCLSHSSRIELDNFQGAFYERDAVDQEKEIDVSLSSFINVLLIHICTLHANHSCTPKGS